VLRIRDGKRWRVINLGQSKVSLLDDQDGCRELPLSVFDELVKRGSLRILNPTPQLSGREKASEIISRAGPEALREATRRYQMIEPYLNGSRRSDQTIPARTRQRWMLQFRTAQATHGVGFLGLLPGVGGNSSPRLPEATRDLMNKFIEENYETLKQKGKFAVYGQYVVECERRCIQAASYRTFATEIDRRPKFEQTLKREGPRAAYAHEPFYYQLSPTIPRHGDRPFEIAHIDHTEVEECRSISLRYIEYRKKQMKEAEDRLLQSLQENPPRSLNQISKEISYSCQTLVRHYPEISRSIIDRYKSYARNLVAEKMEARLINTAIRSLEA
jgi:putative transposase